MPPRMSKIASSTLHRYLRNIGIVAHINAGKTTTTERILFNAGSTNFVGDVDKGNTVTDYLVQERNRGITITSAAVTFDWNKHRINLIDTPGHVDFAIEVERSLSVLDGVVTILDASAGVEAQTVTVWNQASKYKLPNIIYLNKYDKPQADYLMCLKDLKYYLGLRANLIQFPVKTSPHEFSTIIDIINRRCITWLDAEQNKGSKFTETSLDHETINLDRKCSDLIEREREHLIDNLSEIDDEFANHVIECDKICDVQGNMIAKALRQATIECKLSPILIGSSFKYIGVQQLLDAIVNYLPCPEERAKQILELLDHKEPLVGKGDCALIFKIMHDKRLGALNYVRVLNGSIKRQQRFENLETKKKEQVKKVYRAFADELKEIENPVYKDDIVVVTGLSESRTGDILMDPSSAALFDLDLKDNCSKSNNNDRNDNIHYWQPTTSMLATEMIMPDTQPVQSESSGGIGYGGSASSNSLTSSSLVYQETQISAAPAAFELLKQQIIVPKISRMEPVYFCSIEALNVSYQLKFEEALASMAREDPSFYYEIDSLGITTIRGLGKLHLEVARDRIESEYGIKSVLGPLQIAYRETIDGSATEELSIKRLINSVNNALTIRLYIRSKPNLGAWSGKQLRLDTSGESSLGKLRNDHRRAIELGLVSALRHGPSLGFPMIDCDILLLEFSANYRCGLPVISSAAGQCLMNAIRRCSPVLLEPIMLLEVVTPLEFAGLLLGDLASRRSIVQSTQARLNGSMVIRSQAPLSTLTSYSEYLRITTSGRASFSMELFSYSAMSETDRQAVARL